jgi:SNF2 family DNA or RNA helicase
MGHRMVRGIREGLEEEFYNSHSRHLVRRLKRDALPGIPPKVLIEIKCGMTKKQLKQYTKFENDAEVEIQSHISGGEPAQVIGTCILAQFTRLKQFANAYCVANAKGEVMPTTDSGKLPYLEEKLDEFGIRRQMPEPNARAIVASESKRFINLVYEWMTESLGISCGLLTGDTPSTSRNGRMGSQDIINHFQEGDDGLPFVIAMTTQTGGVSLNLERADSVHVLDEHWNPDRQEQLEDRGDRGTRQTPLRVCYYRTAGTVQEYIAMVAAGKKLTNSNVLDTYRLMKQRTGFARAT